MQKVSGMRLLGYRKRTFFNRASRYEKEPYIRCYCVVPLTFYKPAREGAKLYLLDIY